MPLDIIVGAQWGDEGKGRMVDLLAARSKIVARFSGGDNAGHTVTVGDQIYKLHLIPSGMVRPNTIGVMGDGMVINPNTLLKEVHMLIDAGVEVNADRLKISPYAHLITPAHRALDAAQEAARGDAKIGTTLRGIGPAYTDKTTRSGLRAGDMLDLEKFADAVLAHVEQANQKLTKLYDAEPLDPQMVAAEYAEYARTLRPHIADTGEMIYQALKAGERVLGEGAQGTLLDLDQGTYPFVTSSHPTAAGALLGLGVGPAWVGKIIGVTKAFQTRVGEGGFITELDGDAAVRLRGSGENPWDEFGTTTGRPRRVGWLDLVLLHYAARVNGFSHLAITKLDILTGIDPLKVCVAYRKDGVEHDHLPMGLASLEGFEPVFHQLPGWTEDIQGAHTWEDLPEAARRYVDFIAETTGIPAGWISVGPERDQMVSRIDV
jgi:adenylosuccinate synthase